MSVRTVLRRRLRSARAPRVRPAPAPPVQRRVPNGSDEAEGSAAAPGTADDARLDTLRGELVRELDRLAASEQGCSADFRRI